MFLSKYYALMLFCFFVAVFSSCAPTLPPLTEKQKNIIIATGDQSTTLELMKTHLIVGTAVLASEYEARVHANKIDAEVAQLLYQDSTKSSTEYTYRFWKRK